MSNKQRPLPPEQAPDTARVYERAKPEKEAGAGRLDANGKATPRPVPDPASATVPNAQDPTRQLNSEDVVNSRQGKPPTESVADAEAARKTARRHARDAGAP
jgi:hypothetical protein